MKVEQLTPVLKEDAAVYRPEPISSVKFLRTELSCSDCLPPVL